uniref:CAP-Gly domain-containing protein n=1 Tax=Chelonoidis abingdonii TaxID=106734 RepID=A0A8C0G4M6_CHEAB
MNHDDPLLSFEVGDRVLVKHIQPGTLMFKGCTSFDDGSWAGVALDKPEGDHDGTYGGVKYFVCHWQSIKAQVMDLIACSNGCFQWELQLLKNSYILALN